METHSHDGIYRGQNMTEKCPVTGKICPHDKTTHVTEINNKIVTSLDLCHLCKDKYMSDLEKEKDPKKDIETVMDFLSKIGIKSAIQLKPEEIKKLEPCSKCGLTLKEFAILSRIGCENCYTHFQTQINGVISRCQAGMVHVGKVPKKWQERQAVAGEDLKTLKLKLKKAIELENYEAAAVLKKKIEELNS
jgi:protein arginine kinase activator